MSAVSTLVLVSVGNTRSRVAVARGGSDGFATATLEPSVVVENQVGGQLEEALRSAVEGLDADRTRALVASVNDGAAPRIAGALSASGVAVVRLGNGSGGTMKVPVAMDVDQPATVGVDRLLCALAASSRSGGAPCAVIDAGTCVTVDYIDRHGVFQGGAIAPGVSMMLRAMHAGTAALPLVEPPRTGAEAAWINQEPAAGALGKDTRRAMVLGAVNAVRGLVRWQVEKFAEAGGAYPRIIATGGDAPLLFDPRGGAGDDLVEHIVPDLQLVGMVSAWSRLHDDAGVETDESAAARDGDDELE